MDLFVQFVKPPTSTTIEYTKVVRNLNADNFPKEELLLFLDCMKQAGLYETRFLWRGKNIDWQFRS